MKEPRTSQISRARWMFLMDLFQCLSHLLLGYEWSFEFASRSSIESAALHIQFETLLKSLADDQKYDHLRLPLQVSTMLTPICLLQELLIHRSSYYSQRYRLIMVNEYHFWDFVLRSLTVISMEKVLAMDALNQSFGSKPSSGKCCLTLHVAKSQYMMLPRRSQMLSLTLWTIWKTTIAHGSTLVRIITSQLSWFLIPLFRQP